MKRVPSDSLKRRKKVFSLFLATTTLAEAAAAAPDDDRVEFVALVGALGCQKRKVQDLLEEGKLWSGLKDDVSQDLAKKRTLEAFFDFCKRGMQSPSAISPDSPVALVPKGKLFFLPSFCSYSGDL